MTDLSAPRPVRHVSASGPLVRVAMAIARAMRGGARVPVGPRPSSERCAQARRALIAARLGEEARRNVDRLLR